MSISPVFSQENDGDDASVRDKMIEYIQERLDLTKSEATKFNPLFLRYFKEYRSTIKENRGDKLILRQKIIDLQLRYRPQFKDIIGEQRGNKIFNHQENFIRELKAIQQERRRNNPGRPLPRRNG
jgi:hypothetical protein